MHGFKYIALAVFVLFVVFLAIYSSRKFGYLKKKKVLLNVLYTYVLCKKIKHAVTFFFLISFSLKYKDSKNVAEYEYVGSDLQKHFEAFF